MDLRNAQETDWAGERRRTSVRVTRLVSCLRHGTRARKMNRVCGRIDKSFVLKNVKVDKNLRF